MHGARCCRPAAADGVALLVAEMLRHLGPKRAFDQCRGMIALSFNIDEDSAAALIADAIQKPMSVIVTGDQTCHGSHSREARQRPIAFAMDRPEIIENIKPAPRDFTLYAD